MFSIAPAEGRFPFRPLFRMLLVLFLLVLGALPVRAVTVTSDKTSYLVLQPVTVTYSGFPGNAKDWISIGPATDPDGSNSLQWFYTSGKTGGTLTFDPIQSPGNYQIRAYYNNGSLVQARASFAVSYPTPQISIDKPGYFVLQKIIVTYSNMAGYSKDYITIVPATAAGNVYNQWFNTNGAKSGTMTFDDLPLGNYQVRVHFNNDDNTVQARLSFTVSYPVPQMSTDKSAYQVLDKIVVTYSNLPGYPKDYITVVSATAADNVYAQWFNTNGAKAGVMTFDPVPPGKYEARLHFNNDDNVVRARVPLTVTNPVSQLTTDKSNYPVLQKILVTYSNLPGYAKDFITLVPTGSKDNAIGPYIYTNGVKTGSMAFNDQPPGSYEARVHYNDDNNVVYARAAFTVSYPIPQVTTSKSSYLVLEKIPITYSNMPGYKTDFVTVVPSNAADNVIGQYFYTAGATAGTMTFDDLPPGTYQARVHFNDDNGAVYARATFGVVYPNTTLSTGKAQYRENEPIVVNYANMPGYPKDYITVVPSTSPDNYYGQYIFTGGAKSGAMTFDPVTAGQYEARVHYNNDDAHVSARYGFTVSTACSFTLAPTSVTIPAASYNSSVTVTASSSTCQWQASTASAWIAITAGTSGTGTGVVNYRVAANTGSAARTDTVTIAGLTFAVTQNAASQIQITSVGNAASLAPAGMASGGIAQGSIVSIFGSFPGLGDSSDPATGITAAVPLATALANVSVQVTQGNSTVNAYPLYVWAGRIDAVIPSTVPLGSANLTVTYKDATSLPAPVSIVASNFGAYATNGRAGGRAALMVQSSPSDRGVQNSNTMTARPGQMVTLYGTGLGAINGPDNSAPPTGDLAVLTQLKVLVGGKPAVAVHAARVPDQPGKDLIQFQLPADAPPGCNTPLQVVTGLSTYSNTVTVAIDPNGQPCSSINPWSSLPDQGGKFANIFLLQVSASLAPDSPPIALELGMAAFTNTRAGGSSLLSLLGAIPSLGTCGTLGGSLNVGSLLGSSTSALPGAQAIQYLDAGPAISVTGPNGVKQLAPAANDDGTPMIPSMYGASLGGDLFADPAPPPFLTPGTYTLSGTGGKDVGAFTASLTVPPPVTWTNQATTVAIDRSAGVPFTWSGGSDQQLVLIAGMASDPNTNATSGFLCFVPSSQGGFTVPVPVLANLSPTTGSSLGALMLGTVPAGAGTTFTANGLDSGLIVYGAFSLTTVAIK